MSARRTKRRQPKRLALVSWNGSSSSNQAKRLAMVLAWERLEGVAQADFTRRAREIIDCLALVTP